jgi:tetratricopeptide (TPR) repeat protein
MPSADRKHKAEPRRTPRGEQARPGEAIGARPRRQLLVPAALVVGLTLLAFLPLLRNGFIDWDDPTQIFRNPRFDPPTVSGLAEYWLSPRLGEEFYVPVNYTVSWLLASVGRAMSGGGLIPAWPYHAASWLVHAANACLVLVIVHRLTGNRWAAAAGAAVFAVHPVQVEPLAWAASNYSPLSGLFAVAAIWQYLIFSDERRRAVSDGTVPAAQPVAPPSAAWAHYLLALLFFAIAMHTKPTVVTVPLVLAAIEIGLRGRRPRDVLLPLGIMLALAAPAVLLVRRAEQAAPVYVPAPPWRALIALDTLAFYLYKLVVPLWLCPDYGRSPQWVLGRQELYYTWVAPVVLLAVVWYFRKATRWPLACVLLFVAALLPTLGLIPFDYQRYSTAADRYLYLAMLAPAAAVAFALARRPRPAYFAAVGVVCVALAVLAHLQSYRWRDSNALFTHTLSVNPRSLAAHVVFGYLYASRGEDDRALAEFDQALRANPGDAAALTHVGNIYLRKGRFAEAAAAYHDALLFGGAHPALNINLGVALAQAGKTEEALAALNEAVVRLPDNPDAHANLANVLAVRQDWAGARQHYEAALRLDPKSNVARQGLARLNSMGR